MEDKYDLLLMIEDMYNIAYALLRQEEYHIQQELVKGAQTNTGQNYNTTAINYEVLIAETRKRKLNYEVERLFKLKEEIRKLIDDMSKEDN